MRIRTLPIRRHLCGIACAVALLCAAAAIPATAAPEQVPDRAPLLSEPLERGALVRRPAPYRQPSVKRIDGDVDDWKGQAPGLGGTWRYDAGEHIYTDFLFDDFGADDGDDAQRLALLTPLRQAESRTARLDQLFQAAGDQFDAPRPIGAPDHYGDAVRSGAGDLREVRWAADADTVNLLVRTTTMQDPSVSVLVLVGDSRRAPQPREIAFAGSLATRRFDTAFLLSDDGVSMTDIDTGRTRRIDAPVAINADGWTNALEAAIPARLLPRKGVVGVVTGHTTIEGFVAENVAYRSDEPVAGTYNEQRQALALHDGTVDEFGTRLDLAALRRGASQQVRPGPGYFERHMRSGGNISTEAGEDGVWQPYGLYVPASYDPAKKTPLTFWLHYRGGKAHSGGAWTPRLITQLGEETGNIVATPRGRGTSAWYVSESHQDFFEVFRDVHGLLAVDPNRRYLSGYSMGGYGTYLFGLLYPDLFAGGFSTSGAVTQGAWTGEGPDGCRAQCFVQANGGDANGQLTYRVLENARHLPLTIHHGTNDELVPITGIERVGARLTELGYRHDLTRFPGYEHYTHAIVDEWADGAQYLNRFRRERNPRTITYKVVPALVNAVNTVTADGVDFDFKPDGAYWSDGLTVRDGAPADPAVFGRLDATSAAIPANKHLAVPRAGVVSPLAHSTPFVRSGLEWIDVGGAEATDNAFTATLTNLSSAELNVQRMRLRTTGLITGDVRSDGPAMLTLTSLDRQVQVFVNGEEQGVSRNGTVDVRLTEGKHLVEVYPY